MVPLIQQVNKEKLITRGCCENNENEGFAYVIFEYNSYMELRERNQGLCTFIDSHCTTSDPYYSRTTLRHRTYDPLEYETHFKHDNEVWIYIQFPHTEINQMLACCA